MLASSLAAAPTSIGLSPESTLAAYLLDSFPILGQGTENPPNDEEVEQIIDEYRMKKYG